MDALSKVLSGIFVSFQVKNISFHFMGDKINTLQETQGCFTLGRAQKKKKLRNQEAGVVVRKYGLGG